MTIYAVLPKQGGNQAVRHYVGLPPEVAGSSAQRKLMPRAQYLILRQTSEGSFLYRYAADGTFAGDTWHSTLDDAKHQATEEFGESFVWQDVPDGAPDPVAYVLKRYSEK